jgi:hypothetical protein
MLIEGTSAAENGYDVISIDETALEEQLPR